MSSQPARPPRLHWRIDDHAGRRYAGAVLSVMGAAQAARWRCDAARGAARVEDDDAHPIACGRTRSTPAERYRADAPGPARCGNREDGSCRGREADDFGEWEPAIVLRSRLHGCGNSRPLTPRVRSLESEARNFLFECVLEQHPACFHPARPLSELHCACAFSLRPNHPRYDLG